MSTEKWKNKDKELIELVKKQAGIPKTLVETQVPVDKIVSLMPTPAELEELEKQFYAESSAQKIEEENEEIDNPSRDK